MTAIVPVSAKVYPPGIDFSLIRFGEGGGALSLRVSEPYHPQNIRGRVWNYSLSADRSRWENGVSVGEFTSLVPTVPVGGPASVIDKLFLVMGTVLQQGDDPPTPYQVNVSVVQGTQELSHEVPADNGSGRLGKDNEIFVYRFVLTP